MKKAWQGLFPRIVGGVFLVIFTNYTSLSSQAANLDTIGVSLLRQVDPALIGTGVKVGQVEAPANTDSPPLFEVEPSNVGQPSSLFYYTSSLGTANGYPNSVGTGSGHASNVGNNFYGTTNGAASGVSRIDNYEANYFYNTIIGNNTAIQAKIVNQSFVFGEVPVVQQQGIDSAYDTYAASKNVLFVSGIGNGGAVNPPATAYNGIGVGAYGSGSSVGPTPDNGRSKPDITAPEGATSFSTPLVAGSAAILVQAALRGDGGSGTATTASDIRTVKALLLNGAIKPTDWRHTPTVPLDARYGAGIVNVFNSWKQLSAGKFAPIVSQSYSSGADHLPPANTNVISSLTGWNSNTITSSIMQDRVDHYNFNLPALPANSGNSGYTFTTTLVWNRAANQTTISDLNLFLYDADNNLVASSVSTVDNVEHLFLPQLAAGRYNLQVFKKGGFSILGYSESYALAFEFFTMPLSISRNGSSVNISWPLAPTGFVLQTTSNLNPPVSWSNVGTAPVVSGNQNVVTLPAGSGNQFFRLRRP